MSLELVEEGDGFFVLRGVGALGWASVEGFLEEWELIAQVLLGDLKRASFKRCAAQEESPGGCVTLWSPRNSVGPRDHVVVLGQDRLHLGRHVLQVLGRYAFASLDGASE